ncbi:MAG: NnrS family protein [Alphaproteobacteria bacterium]|nr:NnrS family protein [Alphaproteobacteria bacterium]
MTTETIEAAREAKRTGPVFLEYGFRPFFLGAGIQAVLAMAGWLIWIYLINTGAEPETLTIAVPVHIWHAHEMIFGYGMAVVAGFLLTAVPSWTGKKPVRGPLLGILFVLWLAARLTGWFSTFLPPLAVALPELAFIAMLSALVVHALLSGWSKRNFLFLPVLAAMFAAALMYHLDFPYPAHMLGLDILLILVTIIGGRVIPAFTTNTLRREGVEPLPRGSDKRDLAPVLALIGMTVADLALPGSMTAGVIAIAAGLFVAIRMIGWRTFKVLHSPIMWILHLGYAWLALGLIFKGIALTADIVSEITAIHALTTGAIGSLTIGVMSRAALGHTGRDLKVSAAITVSYMLISIATIIRISESTLPGEWYYGSVLISGVVWIAAFLIFTVIYWPILTRPRIKLAEPE